MCLSSHPPTLAPPSASFWTPQLLWDWVIHHPPFNQTRQGQNYECLKIHCLFLPVKYMKVLLPSWHSPSSLRFPSPLYCAPWGHEQRKLCRKFTLKRKIEEKIKTGFKMIGSIDKGKKNHVDFMKFLFKSWGNGKRVLGFSSSLYRIHWEWLGEREREGNGEEERERIRNRKFIKGLLH